MEMILLEVGNLDGLIAIMLAIMLGPPLVLGLIGFGLSKNDNRNAAKGFYILAAIYLIVGLGICGGLAGGF